MCDVREYFERSMLLAAMKKRVTFLRPVDSCAAAPSMAATRVDNLFNNPSEGNLSRLAANAGRAARPVTASGSSTWLSQ